MKILILSANTGGGHNSAAGAITQELSRRGIESNTVDCLSYLSELTSEFISWGHSYVYRNFPQLFGKAYEFEERHPAQAIYDFMSLGAENFYEAVRDAEYDAVICVHVFAGMLVTAAQRKFGHRLPLYFVATDYTCSPGVNEIEADAFFIPDKDLIEEFIACGVPRKKIVPTGIPIREVFYAPTDVEKSRKKLHLPPKGTVVLLSFGSIGCGRIDRVAPEFSKRLPEDATLVIICGHNKKAYKQLKEQNLPNTVVVGFTEQMAEYMKAADVCLSKPGGLSTTEMMTLCLPMVLILAVPGCESYNLSFFTQRSFALGASDWEEAMERTLELLGEPDKLRRMRENMAKHETLCGAGEIADFVEKNTQI